MTTNKKWFVKGDEVGYISDHDDQSFGMFCPVAVIYDEECARLIAAAPDLLDALQVLFDSYKQLADSGDSGFWKLEEQPEGQQALAAIAKATGEQE